MLRSGFWLLLPWLLGACALPVNTALRDWSRLAETTVTQAPATPSKAAIQRALAAYFQALVTLWDGSALAFDAPAFTALAAGQPEAEAAAIRALGEALRAASADTPPRWLPPDNSGPRPAYEDGRLSRLIREAAGPVRVLLLAVSDRDETTTGARALAQILTAQEALAAEAGRVRQRETERRLFSAAQALRRLQAQQDGP